MAATTTTNAELEALVNQWCGPRPLGSWEAFQRAYPAWSDERYHLPFLRIRLMRARTGFGEGQRDPTPAAPH